MINLCNTCMQTFCGVYVKLLKPFYVIVIFNVSLKIEIKEDSESKKTP